MARKILQFLARLDLILAILLATGTIHMTTMDKIFATGLFLVFLFVGYNDED